MFEKILIYGENWQGTLPCLLLQDLTAKGFDVSLFDYTDIMPGIKHRDFWQKVRRRLFGEYYRAQLRKIFLVKILQFRPEVIIISKGFHLDPETIKEAKKNCRYLINWNPDDFFNYKNSNPDLIESMKLYDLIISSRPHLEDDYRKRGMKNFLYLDWYYVPELHKDYGLPLDIDASFVGSWSPFREKTLLGLDKKFVVYGGGWEKSSMSLRSKHKLTGQTLNQVEMAQIFNRSRFNLNLLTHENNDLTNLRIFEVTGSKGLLITPRNDVVSKYLQDGVDCLMFSDERELNELLNKKSDDLAIRQAGHYKIMSGNNTFSHRVDTLIHALGDYFHD